MEEREAKSLGLAAVARIQGKSLENKLHGKETSIEHDHVGELVLQNVL